MLNINVIMFTARLTGEPETRQLQSGKAVSKVNVAINNPYKDKDGNWHSKAVFMTVECFDKTAERVAELAKGQPVYVEGRLKMDEWEKDGKKYTKVLVLAHSVKTIEKAQAEPQEPRASDGLNFGAQEDDDDIDF